MAATELTRVGMKVVFMLNVLNVVIVLPFYFLRHAYDDIDIVKNPIFTIRVISVTVLVWSIMSINAVNAGWQQIKAMHLVKSTVVVGLVTLLYHVIAVLYGAPLVESATETFHFALLLSAVTSVPSCCVLGANAAAWTRVYIHRRSNLGLESSLQITTLCSLVGAWLGAFPIPLDWDRPWQVWPVSCAIGTLGGYVLGLVMANVYLLYCYRQQQKLKLG